MRPGDCARMERSTTISNGGAAPVRECSSSRRWCRSTWTSPTDSRGREEPGSTSRPGSPSRRATCDVLSEDVLHHEPHVSRTFGEPAHVPRELVLPVADEHPEALALLGQPQLLTALDAVKHRELVRGRG